MNGDNYPPNHLNLPSWSYKPKLKGLSGLYINTAIRQLAFNLMGIFMPIYILKITQRIDLVFFYFFIAEAIILLGTAPTAKLIRQWGPDVSILFSNISRSICLILLTFAKHFPIALWLAPIFSGLTTTLYWLPYHTAFSTQSKKKKLSRQIARVSNITRVVTLLAPFIGGLIAEGLGFDTLFPIGILLLIVSSLPIFLDQYDRKEKSVKFKQLAGQMFSAKEKNLYLSLFFEGFRCPLNAIGWPLILATVIPNLEKIGALTTTTSLICLALITFLSKKIKTFKVKPFAVGNLGRSFVWIIRGLFITNPLVIILSDSIFNIGSLFFALPYNLMIYHEGKKQKLTFFIKRQLSLHGGYAVACLLFFFLTYLDHNWLSLIQITIIATILMTIFAAEHSRQKKDNKIFKVFFGRL